MNALISNIEREIEIANSLASIRGSKEWAKDYRGDFWKHIYFDNKIYLIVLAREACKDCEGFYRYNKEVLGEDYPFWKQFVTEKDFVYNPINCRCANGKAYVNVAPSEFDNKFIEYISKQGEQCYAYAIHE